MLSVFRKGPTPLARVPTRGTRVRVGYQKRGPWFEGEVLEASGKVMKVRLDEAGVTYYVRTPKRWLDAELRKVIVAAPDATPVANGPRMKAACCSACAKGRRCETACPSKSRGRTRAKSRPLTRRELAEVRRAQLVLQRSAR